MHHFEKAVQALLGVKFESVQYKPDGLNWITLYGQNFSPDFLVSEKLCFEVRYQDVSGTTDQKLVYIVEQIRKCHQLPTYLVIGGTGWSSGAIKWLRKQPKDTIYKGAIDINEFIKWLNNV